MAEEYTGNEGTEAADEGWDILDGTEDRRDGWLAINKTRDMIARVLRSISWANLVGKPNSFPNSDVTAATAGATEGALVRYGTGGRINVGAPDVSSNAATKGYVDDQSLRSGGTVNGALTIAGNAGVDGRLRVDGNVVVANATAATSGYTVAYINGDGRLSKGASSERYKTDIDRAPDLPDVFAVPITSYVMQEDPDEVPRYGPIAEDLHANEVTAPFVVYDAEGRPDSFDMVSYLMAAVGRLHTRALDAEARLAALEGNHETD